MSSLDTGPDNVARGSDGLRIGLCLSGGGFRAALYALGVVRYLAEADLLRHVQAVSAVSGGSVAAAALADRWPAIVAEDFALETYLREVNQPFTRGVSEHNIRNAAIRRWAFRRATFRGPTRGSATGEVLVEQLLHARRVVDLDPALQVILTSTDLATGRAFRVSREFIGSYDFKYQPPAADLSLGTAVAASAAVPLLFPPVYLPTAGLGLKDAPDVLSLVDGGVYDNLGLEWFQGWDAGRPDAARAVNFIIVIDASGPFHRSERRLRGFRAVRRSREIQYFQTRASRVRWLVEGLLGDRRRGIYVATPKDPRSFRHPDGTPADPAVYDGSLPAGYGRALGNLRTDLDRFLPEEASLLGYHGYWSVHARFAMLFPELAVSGPPQWRDHAELSVAEDEALRALLERGKKRRLRR